MPGAHLSFENQTIPESLPWSIRAVETLLQRHPILSNRWHYEPGVALLAVQRIWELTRQKRYFEYIQHNITEFVAETGNICTYNLEEYNLDQINPGKLLFMLSAETGDKRYEKAIHVLREQLRTQPRNTQGGFWHKLRYPHQMWLDGIYMAAPFYAQYAATFNDLDVFDDIARQVILLDRHARDPQTSLLFHAWDASRSQEWANPKTGCSPNIWARAIGWFMMALPDILDYYPYDHLSRPEIIRVFRQTAEAVVRFQDKLSAVWYQVLDQGERAGNYLEASASCMFVYALAKAFRLGYLDRTFLQAASRGFQGILDQFIEVGERGWINLNGICSVSGLGGTPYRDGSFEYYISEPVVSNDYKGFGPFIMASLEIECAKVKQYQVANDENQI
jgi:unsaturated rhamnogalacturonyl hydrolase